MSLATALRQMSMAETAAPVEAELPAGAFPCHNKPLLIPHTSYPTHHTPPPSSQIDARLSLAVLDPHKIERVIDVINPRVTK